MLDDYKKHKGSWEEYEHRFLALMADRKVEEKLDPGIFAVPTVLLCSEPTPDHCHRRLVLEYLQQKWSNLTITTQIKVVQQVQFICLAHSKVFSDAPESGRYSLYRPISREKQASDSAITEIGRQ